MRPKSKEKKEKRDEETPRLDCPQGKSSYQSGVTDLAVAQTCSEMPGTLV